MKTSLRLVLLFCAFSSPAFAQSVKGLPACSGGAFAGSRTPTYRFTPNDSRNCVASPTRSDATLLGHGPMPTRKTVRPNSVGYHFAGSETTDATYHGIEGWLQMNYVDISGAGSSAFVDQTYLMSPDGGTYFQTGWIKEIWHGDVERIFTESNAPGYAGRDYYEQYALSYGDQYYFDVSVDNADWYMILWWNGSWNILRLIPVSGPGLTGIVQQFLEVYSSNGVHPTVPTMTNNDTHVYTFDWGFPSWDGSIDTLVLVDSPYCVNWLATYSDWQAGSCP